MVNSPPRWRGLGPDDDEDAVFANRSRSIEIEAYCNRGEPTVGEVERTTVADD